MEKKKEVITLTVEAWEWEPEYRTREEAAKPYFEIKSSTLSISNGYSYCA